MALTIDTVKNFAEWNQPQWRAFFRMHGEALVKSELPQDVVGCLRSVPFQEALIKVGIIGSRVLFEQIPRIGHRELNPKIPPMAAYGEPRHFIHVARLVTRLKVCDDDYDEALLIKLERSREPLMLIRHGEGAWFFRYNATEKVFPSGGSSYKRNDRDVLRAWQVFEKAAKACADEHTRSTLLVQYLQEQQFFSAPLASLVASYNELYIPAEAPAKPAEEMKSGSTQSWCAYISLQICALIRWLLSWIT